jgi:cysteine desulfurase
MQTLIYMDNNATTRVDPRVVEAMLPYFSEDFGAEAAVEKAREQVAGLIGATPREIVFTSGATESNNLALKGAAAMHKPRGDHVVTCVTEHHAVLDAAKRERDGFRVTYLPVDRYGQVSAEQVDAAITDRTTLVSLMAANNEVGTLHPIAEVGAVCKRRGVLFHTDAAQAVGKLPIDVEAAPRASAPSTSAGARRQCGWSRCSTAAATSAGCAPARSTCRASSASAQRASFVRARWPAWASR